MKLKKNKQKKLYEVKHLYVTNNHSKSKNTIKVKTTSIIT